MTDQPIWVDTDNALGSPIGDIDDAIAITALLKTNVNIQAVSNVFGNTFQNLSFKNTKVLLSKLNYQGPHYSGADTWWTTESQASRALAKIENPITLVALGPLTNLANALKENPALKPKIKCLIFVGLNYERRLPNWRVFDFNVFKDKPSVDYVLNLGIPTIIVPCNVARGIRMRLHDLDNIRGEVGSYLRSHSLRWFLRSKILKFNKTIPVWDLCASMYVISPEYFQLKPAKIVKTKWNNLHLVAGPKSSHIQSVTGFNPEVLIRIRQILSS